MSDAATAVKTEKTEKTGTKKPAPVKKKTSKGKAKATQKPITGKRTIRRAVDVWNSELRDIAAILQIRSPLPRTKEQREELLRQIRRKLQ
jgi:hypothetical protein